MDPLCELGRKLLFLGGFVVLIGALLFFGGELPFRLGRLPGDIIHRGEHTTIYFSDRDLLGAQYRPKPSFLAFLSLPPLTLAPTSAISVQTRTSAQN